MDDEEEMMRIALAASLADYQQGNASPVMDSTFQNRRSDFTRIDRHK